MHPTSIRHLHYDPLERTRFKKNFSTARDELAHPRAPCRYREPGALCPSPHTALHSTPCTGAVKCPCNGLEG